MNGLPTAGTFRLDGMLQGSFPPDADTVAELQSWVDSAKANGVIFHLRVEGANYSLMADAAVRKISLLRGGDIEGVLVEKLQELLDILPPDMRARSFSTIRSEEFRQGTAVQTIYTVGRDGQIKSEQRVVDADTADAAPEITPASLSRGLLPAFVLILLTLFASTFFIDYRRLFTDARDRIAPLKKEELSVDQELAEDFITFELTEVVRKKSAMIFTLKRGARWEAAMQAKPAAAMELEWQEFNTLMAIRQGRCRITLLDKLGRPLLSREIDVRGLQEKESIEVALLADSNVRISSAVLGW
ncbi:MAG: hypothetical protein V4727_02960 [Verrucomicrobiota bacterium]